MGPKKKQQKSSLKKPQPIHPPKRMGLNTGGPKIFSLKSSVLGLLLFLFITGYVAFQLHGKSSPTSTTQTIIDVQRGESIQALAQNLEQKGLIKSEKWLLRYLTITKKDRLIRAGRYAIPGQMSLVQTVEILTNKDNSQHYVKLTIPEGFTIKEIAQKLEQDKLVSANMFLKYVTTQAKEDFVNEFSWLKDNPTSSLEGYLFPDTYFFAVGTSHKNIVSTMLKQTEEKLWPLFEASPPKKLYGFHRMLTIASIVQKEAGNDTEMPMISSVFFNRLKKMKRLESCPTILYAIGDPEKTTLNFKDLELESPYNTYRIFGLPPTPISSPGIAAFQATLYPPKSDYMFFVSNNNGSHTFSKTYKAHLHAQRVINKKSKK